MHMKHSDHPHGPPIVSVTFELEDAEALTGTTGVQAKESIDINKSLLVLRKVITALTD